MTFKDWLEKEKNLSIKNTWLLTYAKKYYAEYILYCENNKLEYQKIKEIE